jgi:hypothetical protein
MRRTIAFLAFVVWTSAAARATPTPAPSLSSESQGYVRFCEQNETYVGRLHAQQLAMFGAIHPADAVLISEAQAQLGLAVPPSLIARRIEHAAGESTPGELVLLGDLSAKSPTYWRGVVAAEGTFTTLEIAKPTFVQQTIGFPREMAAYALFNDLAGGDATIPRAGCARLFDAWYENEPSIDAEVDRAMTTEPASDAALESAVRSAWDRTIAHAPTGPGSELTRDTLTRIGADPEVTIVYHDVGLPGDGIGPINVVRIGSARARTYAIVTAKPPDTFGSESPLCIVGDTRCAPYYAWP